MTRCSVLRQRGGTATSIFGLMFLIIGVGIGIYFAKGLFEWVAARDWVAVEARLLRVDLESHHDSEGGTTWRVTADYEYDWRGERFTASRVDLHSGADNLGDYHRDLHRRLNRAYRAGEPVTAWVDPEDPSRAVLERGMRWGRLGLGMLFPLVFGGAGLAIVYASRRSGRAQRKIENRKELHPDEPWMWFDRWRTPRISAEASARTWLAIGFAVFWNLVSLPLVFIVPDEVAAGNRAAWVGLIFPLVGIGLIVWAVREVIRRRRYGNSVVQLETHPVPLGGVVRGTLDIPARLDAREIQLQLACVNRYTSGSGKNRRTRERVLWEDKQRAMTRSGTGPGRTSAPVEVALPNDQPVASEDDVRNRIIWRLTATSAEPGVDYKAVFELPVFDTGQGPAAAAQTPVRAAAAGRDEWRETGVRHQLIAGGQRFAFPRFRMLGSGLGLAAIALVFAGSGAFMVVQAGHWIFGGIFALFGLLLVWGAISMLFQQSEIVIGNGRLRWRHGVFARWRETDAAAIKSLTVKRSGSVGSDLYFRIEIERWGGDGKTAIADWVPGQRPSEALVAHFNGLLGRPVDA